MDKIKVLFIQEKQIKKKAKKVITLGDLIENEVPDMYEIAYVSIKEDVMGKINEISPQILFVARSKVFELLELVKRIRELFPSVVILVNLATTADSEQEIMLKLKEMGVYKCYGTTLSIDSLVHDMFVALNIE